MSTHEDIAARLRTAYDGQTIPPLRPELGATDIDAAYAVQQINTDFWSASGRKMIGRKIGLTSKAVQQQLGVDQPDFGVLFDDMSIENAGTLTPAGLIQPKAEAEIALVIGKDLADPTCTPELFASATEYAMAAIEIVDSRIEDWKITFADTVADNGSSARFVLGNEKKKLEGLDLYTCGMVVEVNDQIASIGAGAACLGHPLNAAAWLVRTLAARGDGLKAGDIVLTGALGPMITLSPGQSIQAKIGGLGVCRFKYEEA